jgi:hypothetical protein
LAGSQPQQRSPIFLIGGVKYENTSEEWFETTTLQLLSTIDDGLSIRLYWVAMVRSKTKCRIAKDVGRR